MSKKKFLATAGWALSLLTAALLVACSGSDSDSSQPAAHQVDTRADSPTALLREDMRALWEDHIAWTRLAIISLATDSQDAATTTARLLQNQADIGDAVKPFYGDEAGNALTALLKDHIVVAAELVTAAKLQNSAAVDDASARWYANADDIGAFLAAANPDHWDTQEMQAMMREHLDLTLAEAVHYLTGDYEASIADYDEIHVQILAMSDMLSDGIAAQFPDAFAVRASDS